MLGTVPHALSLAANAPGAGLRFLDRQERADWHPHADVWARARRAAGALHAAGVRRGDAVALILPTGLPFFDAWFGCQLLGAIPTALYPPVRLGRLDEYVERTVAMMRVVNAVVLVTDARVHKLLGRVVLEARPRLGVLDAATLSHGTDRGPDTIDADDLAMIQFSSGTTVDPKPVALSHRQILANAGAITGLIHATTPPDGDPTPAGVSWLPLYHDMGLIGCVLPSLLVPGPLTLIPPEQFLARPALWLRAIGRWRGTISPAPNFAYALCVERVRDDELDGIDLSSWRMALNGAEPVAPAVCDAFLRRFSAFGLRADAMMPVYGLSEMSLAVTAPPPGRGLRVLRAERAALSAGRFEPHPEGASLVSVGLPLPDHRVRIVNSDGAEVGEDTVGRVHAAGPSRMTGYVGRDVQPFDGPWLDTGDLGLLHDGELYVTGRAKDLIVLRGKNHAPQDIERAVDSVHGMRTGCAAAVADLGDDGERLIVFAEVRERQDGQAEAVAESIRAACGVSPDLVVLLDPGTLPRTSSGKIRRGESLRRWHVGDLAPPADVTPWRLAGALAQSAWSHLRARWGR